jgi:succinate dehydrogenase/fumarate reductase cytochrome b subunit
VILYEKVQKLYYKRNNCIKLIPKFWLTIVTFMFLIHFFFGLRTLELLDHCCNALFTMQFLKNRVLKDLLNDGDINVRVLLSNAIKFSL